MTIWAGEKRKMKLDTIRKSSYDIMTFHLKKPSSRLYPEQREKKKTLEKKLFSL